MSQRDGQAAADTKAVQACVLEAERQRQAVLAEAAAVFGHLNLRTRPLRRMNGRALDLAPLIVSGLVTGPLRPGAGERPIPFVRRLLRTGRNCSPPLTQLFDPIWYVRRYPDVTAVNPALHYALHGCRGSYDPSPLFANAWYIDNNPDVLKHAITPILHYRLVGAASGCDPHPLFDTKWYMAQCTAPIQATLGPLEHFLLVGWKEGKDPGPWFQTSWYQQRYAGQEFASPNPVVDYLIQGAERDRDPGPYFCTKWYRERYADVSATGLNPLFHFLVRGRAEGRRPLPPDRHRQLVTPTTGADLREIRTNDSEPSSVTILSSPLWPKSVLVVTDRVTATQEISFSRPLAALTAESAMILRMESARDDWDSADVRNLLDSAAPDILVLSRYTLPQAHFFVALARERDIPVLFHIDDDLLDVPLSLGQGKQAYRDPARLEALRHALDGSDLVYTSTEPLARRLESHGILAPIVHGDVYCSADPNTIPATYPSTTPVIGYMGTSGHGADLALIAPVLERLLDAMPALSFETFGTIAPLAQLERFGDRVLHHGPVSNYAGFLDQLCGLGWWVGLAPLEDNPFNRCKADTKWVEYTYSGIAVMAQDLPVYSRACANGGGVLASSEPEWAGAAARLMRNPGLRRSHVQSAQEKLRTMYSHAALRRQLLNVFEQARVINLQSWPRMRARR